MAYNFVNHLHLIAYIYSYAAQKNDSKKHLHGTKIYIAFSQHIFIICMKIFIHILQLNVGDLA